MRLRILSKHWLVSGFSNPRSTLFTYHRQKYLGGTAPIFVSNQEVYANPLPHVLILTAIVVGVATIALGLALVVRIYEAYGTLEEDQIQDIDLGANNDA